ncbi:class I SAM-dependent methyltransferase [Pseudoxanthomonas dokdonensis]|uniref:Methyltransferase n=1 Tax=Pseudoxanthomonas dokdonensis TaxID=344882 RepID=A0A0R0D427_9GAMM|nr:class I SAM-dependent methyltransferase [Pseudoxanthomonas dokdonensis]KRG72088.1 methyltransferase [Pseudoxanthomonas dokdonensis]
MNSLFSARLLPACLLLALAAPLTAGAEQTAAPIQQASEDAALAAVIKGDWRSADNVARDSYRHPAQTLAFFGLKPDQTVVEITPGGGWYAEILAPYLRDSGQYVAAVVDPTTLPAGGGRDYQQRSRDKLDAMFAAGAAQYDKARVVAYDPAKPVFGAPDSADLVLTFRNVHNWMGAGQAEDMFKGFFEVLKSGGTLGVVEHRANAAVGKDDKSGYVGQDQVIAMATAAGFKLQESSEINANPRDSKDHPNGVWTLPPSNRHDEADNAKYQTIGESDRMTLRFVKP